MTVDAWQIQRERDAKRQAAFERHQAQWERAWRPVMLLVVEAMNERCAERYGRSALCEGMGV